MIRNGGSVVTSPTGSGPRGSTRTANQPLVPVQEGFVAVGESFRAWRWVEERYLPKDHGQEVVARDVLSRQVLITEIVTVLDSEQVAGSSWPRYTVRKAAPVEVARVLCAEATWCDAELDTR